MKYIWWRSINSPYSTIIIYLILASKWNKNEKKILDYCEITMNNKNFTNLYQKGYKKAKKNKKELDNIFNLKNKKYLKKYVQ